MRNIFVNSNRGGSNSPLFEGIRTINDLVKSVRLFLIVLEGERYGRDP